MKIVKKILKSFLKFVLFTALLHIGVLIITAIRNGNIKFLNYFQILGLHEFWPKITNGKLSDILSIILMTIIFLSFLIFSFIKKIRVEKVES
ncbi:MAG: hypothetical protein PHX34_03500 [Candidatus Shapirobacteria bacterium]|nr:hypothetical protein [Candidatus Shapirobacteria bacterium]